MYGWSLTWFEHCAADSLGAGSVPRMIVGSEETRLVVVRGNSASGKSSVAAGIRDRFGRRLALVGQDNLRRIVLRERDVPGGTNIGLIDTAARYPLDADYHVVVEGILYSLPFGSSGVCCGRGWLFRSWLSWCRSMRRAAGASASWARLSSRVRIRGSSPARTASTMPAIVSWTEAGPGLQWASMSSAGTRIFGP